MSIKSKLMFGLLVSGLYRWLQTQALRVTDALGRRVG